MVKFCSVIFFIFVSHEYIQPYRGHQNLATRDYKVYLHRVPGIFHVLMENISEIPELKILISFVDVSDTEKGLKSEENTFLA